jgi:hypothetical protein
MASANIGIAEFNAYTSLGPRRGAVKSKAQFSILRPFNWSFITASFHATVRPAPCRESQCRGGRAAALLNFKGEGAPMHSQLVTAEDEENYGGALIDMSKRAALDALSPALAHLQAENQQLRGMAQRSQRVEIERTLDQSVPDWRSTYANPNFAAWLAGQDDYSAVTRSQLLRHAVAVGDAGRVAAIYKGFQAQAGLHASAARQSRQGAAGGKPVYGREDIRRLYEQRRLGHINDAKWGPIESDIVKAAAEGRVVGAVGPDGTAVSRWR